jgi:bifunctional non-homologous end joining protein LigD
MAGARWPTFNPISANSSHAKGIRSGNTFKSFAALRSELTKLGRLAILDGEIVCLDATGKPQFYDLMLRRGEPIFYAFDVLWLDGEDLREHPTLERKRILKDLVRNQPRILYARHVQAHGIDLFRLVCEQDLEGMVCKRPNAAYVTRADCKPPVS